MEFLAAIAANPTVLPLWAVFLFAVGFYPVGMLFGCSPCCELPPCEECEEGELPDTVTVAFHNLQQTTPSEHLLPLEFVSCYGYGAVANVTAPGGDKVADRGPIESVSLVNGGTGYAVYGRSAPTLTATAPNGSGAVFGITTTKTTDSCSRDVWEITGITVTSGGSGYPSSGTLTLSGGTGDTAESNAVVTFTGGASEPTLTASASGGTGASLTVNVSKYQNSPPRWEISSISVAAGGTGYTNGSSVTISLGAGDVSEYAAKATIVTGGTRTAPSITGVQLSNTAGGTGASLTPNLESYTSGGQTLWRLASITINDGGVDYIDGKIWNVYVTDGEYGWGEGSASGVIRVDGNGTITSIEFWWNLAAYKSPGEIVSVSVTASGEYYKGGSIGSVSITSGGKYYHPDPELTPYVADVEVDIVPSPPRGGMGLGTGATFSAVIDDDTASPTFGEITGVTIDDPGDDYLAYVDLLTHCCQDYYGTPIVLRRSAEFPCKYTHTMCAPGGSPSPVIVEYRGASLPPQVYISPGGSSEGNFCAAGPMYPDEPIANCSAMTFTAYGPNGMYAEVTAGGTYDGTRQNRGGLSCHPCCFGDSDVPEEIEVTLDDTRTGRSENVSGNYVLTWDGPLNGWYMSTVQPVGVGLFNGVSVLYGRVPCASKDNTGWYCTEDDWEPSCCMCHKTCASFVDVKVYANSNGPSDWYRNSDFDNSTAETCGPDRCRPTPICDSEPGREFSLCPIYDNGGQCGYISVTNQ